MCDFCFKSLLSYYISVFPTCKKTQNNQNKTKNKTEQGRQKKLSEIHHRDVLTRVMGWQITFYFTNLSDEFNPDSNPLQSYSDPVVDPGFAWGQQSIFPRFWRCTKQSQKNETEPILARVQGSCIINYQNMYFPTFPDTFSLFRTFLCNNVCKNSSIFTDKISYDLSP